MAQGHRTGGSAASRESLEPLHREDKFRALAISENISHKAQERLDWILFQLIHDNKFEALALARSATASSSPENFDGLNV